MDNPFADLIPAADASSTDGGGAPQNPFADLTPKKAPGLFDDLIPKPVESSDMMAGLKRGLGSLKQDAGSALEVAGRFAGSEGLTGFGADMRKSGGETVKNNPARVGKLEDIKGVGDAADYAQGVVSEQAPVMAPMLLGAGAGFAIGGVPGAIIGGALGAYGINLGDLYSTLVDEGLDPEKAKNWASAGAVPISLLDSVAPEGIARRLLGKDATHVVVRGLARRIVGETAKTAAKEGVTEAAQEAMQMGIEGQALDQTFAQRGGMSRVENAGVAGALSGGATGGVEGIAPDRGHAAYSEPLPTQHANDVSAPYTAAQQAQELGWTPEDLAAMKPSDVQDIVSTGLKKGEPGAPGPKGQLALPAPKIEVDSEGTARTSDQMFTPVDERQAGKEPDTAREFPITADKVAEMDATDRQSFRREISKATGIKGVHVYDGEDTSYDPLTNAITVSKGVAPDDTAIGAISGLTKQPKPDGWHAATVKATLDDGSEVEVKAGKAADVIGSKMRRARAILECMG